MPPRKGQMATPATRRDSQELAKEAADRDIYGMDVDYESPTPRPQLNEEMLQIMQQMQQQLREQESRHQAMMRTQSAQIDELKQRMQTGDGQPQNQHNQPPPHNASNSSIDDLMRWVQSNTNLIKNEEEQIV